MRIGSTLEDSQEWLSYENTVGDSTYVCLLRSTDMHVHGNQINLYSHVDTVQDLEKTASKQRAESVRKKLLESSPKLAGEDGEEDCVVKLGAREQSEDQT